MTLRLDKAETRRGRRAFVELARRFRGASPCYVPQLTGETITDPVTGQPVQASHGGAAGVAAGTACTDAACHSVLEANAPAAGMSMEVLARERGGVWAPTPIQAASE